MKKLIVMGIVLAMALGLSVAASADFVKDTDWAVYFSLNNGVFTSATQSYGNAGADVKLGCATVPAVTNGASYTTSTIAVVRDLSATGNGYGLTGNLKAALDQTDAVQVQEWGSISLWANGGYVAANLYLKMWAVGIGENGPALQLVVTQAQENSGFTLDQVVWSSIANSTKAAPAVSLDLTPYKAAYVGDSSAAPTVTLKLVATTPAIPPVVVTPEPGSMVALLSGLVGLVGFGIRRRK